MFDNWHLVLDVLQTLTQILTAGIAITAFSLLIYSFTFNLRNRVARSFMLILVCVVTVFTADALGSISADLIDIEFWLRLQWVGILFLPAAYLHFSDALMETTGRPSRGRRRMAVRFCYLFSFLFVASLPFNIFVGPVVLDQSPAPFLQTTTLTIVFVGYYLGVMTVAWINFWRAYRRTTNSTSRRRMAYLIAGAAAPALGSFPFLLFDSGYASLHQILFWLTAFLSNILVGGLLVVMAYAVAFFGVSWTDRVVKARLFKWLMRGPITASVTLGLVTIVRRTGDAFGFSYSAFVPIAMVVSILLLEHMITLFAGLAEGFLFDGGDRAELELLRELEDRLLTRNDLRQFLEMILSAVRDRVQASGSFVAALNGDGFEVIAQTGHVDLEGVGEAEILAVLETATRRADGLVGWRQGYLMFLAHEGDLDRKPVGVLGMSGANPALLDEDALLALGVLARRAALALRDRQIQHQIFQTLSDLTPQVDLIQSLRAEGRYNEIRLSQEELLLPEAELTQWVKEALTHYWGGPKLTESPLIQLQLVQKTAATLEGNTANALRAVLREAIDRVKPAGERKFTAEWILYNILEMKFMEGRKVREIALRLAMSEADLYRKQRVAIDAVAKIIMEMESTGRKEK